MLDSWDYPSELQSMAPYVVPRLGIHPSLVDISKSSINNLLKYDFLYYFGSIFCIFFENKLSKSRRRFVEVETSPRRPANSFLTQNSMDITMHLFYASKIVGKGLNFDHFETYRNNIVHRDISTR